IQNGWLTWLTRIAAVSAVANLFITYLTEFFPGATKPLPRAAILTALIGFLAIVNYRGVVGGNQLSNIFTVTKVSLLAFFVITGLTALAFHPNLRANPAPSLATSADWFEALLLMIYSYGGFEAALIASGETRDARKDIPFALFVAIGATTLLYIAVRSEEHTSELQSQSNLVCRLLLEKTKTATVRLRSGRQSVMDSGA